MTSPMIAFALKARTIVITRGTVIIGAAFATLVAPLPTQANELALKREQVELVAPPFVHPHEQATEEKPKIVAFRMDTQEKKRALQVLSGRTHSEDVGKGEFFVPGGGHHHDVTDDCTHHHPKNRHNRRGGRCPRRTAADAGGRVHPGT